MAEGNDIGFLAAIDASGQLIVAGGIDAEPVQCSRFSAQIVGMGLVAR